MELSSREENREQSRVKQKGKYSTTVVEKELTAKGGKKESEKDESSLRTPRTSFFEYAYTILAIRKKYFLASFPFNWCYIAYFYYSSTLLCVFCLRECELTATKNITCLAAHFTFCAIIVEQSETTSASITISIIYEEEIILLPFRYCTTNKALPALLRPLLLSQFAFHHPSIDR
mmetsp:Transcript_24304/g.57572  ORF Transcript_24304/g.57572 Transcript_24304/m.57572 type:complete len:175 (+) Transcript_24304:239-763(+)